MGGKPLCAMNIVTFPIDDMDITILQEILRGGLDKMKEAEVSLVGGHSVTDPEIKYGLSVTGLLHPNKILTNRGAQPNDILILTKPLGTGIINTAVKAEMASAKVIENVTQNMNRLNKTAAEVMLNYEIHACTDVTGFGLLGHVQEMIEDSGLCLEVKASSLPHYKEAREHAACGLLPAGLHRNKAYWKDSLQVDADVDSFFVDLVCDPQTSGGLLIAVSPQTADEIIDKITQRGDLAVSIGKFTKARPEKLVLKS